MLTPAVTLWSGALKDLHSDYLQWILQTQNNPMQQLTSRIFYWPQYLLAWSWDLGLTARLNALVRVGSFVYCILWCSRLVSVAAWVRWWKVCVGLVMFCVVWVWWWPELGDSLVYSGTSLGVLVFLGALGDPSELSRRLSGRWFPLVLAVASFVATATYVQSLLVMFPLFVWVVWFIGGVGVGRRWGLLVSLVAGGGAAVLRLRASGDEETGMTTFGLLTRIRMTRHLWDGTLYLWDSLRAAAVLVLLTSLLSWRLRSAKLVALGVAGFVVSVSVVPIAALRHVQANLMMPRYFSTLITIGLLVQFLVVVALAWILLERRTAMRFPSNATKLLAVAKLVAVVTAVVSVGGVSVLPLGFGLDYRDQSGNRKTGAPLVTLTRDQLREMQAASGRPIVVFVDFWNLYPSIFLLQHEGVRAFALESPPIFDVHQAGFKDLLRSRNFIVVCGERNMPCNASLQAVLDARGIVDFRLDQIGLQADELGRSFRLMSVKPAA